MFTIPEKLTSKLKALVWAIVAALTELLSHIANIPPEQQTEYIGAIVNILPDAHRAAAGIILKVLARIAGLYAIYHASHSGPQTPPKNPPE